MTTDWWSTSSPLTDGDDKPLTAPGWDPGPEPVTPPSPPEAPRQEGPEASEPNVPDRRKMLVIGAVGAAVVGVLVFAVIPHDGTQVPTGSQKTSPQSPGGSLPAAGGGPAGMPEEDKAESSRGPEKAAEKVATITATSSGKGQIGAVVEVSIHNGTDDTLTVMPSLVKGDGRPAVIGEGTLAPGILRIEPGATGRGTVEFASGKAPSQIALVDLAGNVVAASR